MEGEHVKAAEMYAEALQKYPCPVSSIDAYIRYMVGYSYLLAKDRIAAKKAWDELELAHPGVDWTLAALAKEAKWTQ
jgi:hypothetical protein